LSRLSLTKILTGPAAVAGRRIDHRGVGLDAMTLRDAKVDTKHTGRTEIMSSRPLVEE
jgi:hypothetical protein